MDTAKTQPYWRVVATCFVCTFLLAMGCVFYTAHAVNASNRAIEASNQAMCPILLILNNVYKSTPPTTDAGKQLATAVSLAVSQYGCMGTK